MNDFIVQENGLRKICFRIYGQPVPKGRPRSALVKSKRGISIPVHYTPQKTKLFESNVQLQLIQQGFTGKELLEGPLKIVIIYQLLKPKSKSKKKKWVDVKPDLDNLVKSILDACEGFLFRNDSQICVTESKKIYTDKQPGTEIIIEELSEE